MRGILLGLMMMLGLSACAGDLTASPTASQSPSPTASASPTERPTVDYAQLTEYATYRPTLVASFTPTYTPSVTGIPSSTATPTLTPTREPMSELVLCPGFSARPYAEANGVTGVYFSIPQNLTLALELLNADTLEVISYSEIPDRDDLTLVFDPTRVAAGNYIWRASLIDATRTGLCAKEGRYTILASPTPRATLEPSPEATAEAGTATATRRPREGRSTEEAGN